MNSHALHTHNTTTDAYQNIRVLTHKYFVCLLLSHCIAEHLVSTCDVSHTEAFFKKYSKYF